MIYGSYQYLLTFTNIDKTRRIPVFDLVTREVTRPFCKQYSLSTTDDLFVFLRLEYAYLSTTVFTISYLIFHHITILQIICDILWDVVWTQNIRSEIMQNTFILNMLQNVYVIWQCVIVKNMLIQLCQNLYIYMSSKWT